MQDVGLGSVITRIPGTIKNTGAIIDQLTGAHYQNNLKKTDIYIIVDPDTEKKTRKPNYILQEHIQAIAGWIKSGGVTVLIEYDSGNAGFTNSNELAKRLGTHCSNGVSAFGKGSVFAVGDPLFNENTDGRKIPIKFENNKAAVELTNGLLIKQKTIFTQWLMQKADSYNNCHYKNKNNYMLNRYTLKNISQETGITLPLQNVFDLPEKVLQFGTGVLLRGLPDYFIDKANRNGVFNGRIVVIKSTDTGDSGAFEKQDGLYTICVRGVENGHIVEENIINSSISRVISAKSEWGKVLQCASNPDIELIISNTTEVGINFVKDDIHLSPPFSFPGKLLSFLYERYKVFSGSAESGMVIIPTELITENGKKLEAIVLELAHFNGLEESFTDWLENSNYFCNSLVDRIVPGTPGAGQKASIESRLQYTDDLLIVAESYRLWAIESANEKVKNVLSFSQLDEGVAIAPDITRFRELKLRLLNGTHTLSCALALLSGFVTVKEAMENAEISGFMKNLMLKDISPAIIDKTVSQESAQQFAASVLDRFRNPHIDHKWISISMQYSSKMKMRNLPVLLNYYERFKSAPGHVALGFAAYILLMKVDKTDAGYSGTINGNAYTIQDDKAAWFSEKWKMYTSDEMVEKVLQEESFWGTDLTDLIGFSAAVSGYLNQLITVGAKQTMKQMLTDKTVVQS